jgi:hypothetical protein
MLKNGKLTQHDFIWREGLEDWIPVGTILPKVSYGPPALKTSRFLAVTATVLIGLVMLFCLKYAYEQGVFGTTASQMEDDRYYRGVILLMGEMSDNIKRSELVVSGAIELYNVGGISSFRDYISSVTNPSESELYESVIKANGKISKSLGEMSNPPKKYVKIFSELEELCDIYEGIVSGAFSSNSSAQEYVSEFERGVKRYSARKERIYAMLPEYRK